MDQRSLKAENEAFNGTRGISANNRDCGLRPAFKEPQTGRIELSRQRDGTPASVHVISWLPREWSESIGPDGAVLALKRNIISGFVRKGVFYTREEAAKL